MAAEANERVMLSERIAPGLLPNTHRGEVATPTPTPAA
jgi:hypothetical protein